MFMTNWKIFVVLVSMLAGAAAVIVCQQKPRAPAASGSSPTNARAEVNKAEQIYEEWGCGTCHGKNAAGSSQGPSLLGLSAHWRREALLRYLKDPVSARATDERLAQLAKRYYPVSMPAFDGLDEAQIEILADHLLKRH
jgi:cytochrome c553